MVIVVFHSIFFDLFLAFHTVILLDLTLGLQILPSNRGVHAHDLLEHLKPILQLRLHLVIGNLLDVQQGIIEVLLKFEPVFLETYLHQISLIVNILPFGSFKEYVENL